MLGSEQVEGFRGRMWVAHPLTGEQHAEVERALTEIEARLKPGRREWIIAIMTRLAVGSYPEVTKDASAFGVRLFDLAEDLAEYSESHLVAAVTEWRRTEKWFPKSSDLVEKLIRLSANERVYRHRALVLLGLKPAAYYELPQPPREEPQPISAERKAEIAARIISGPMAASLRAVLDGADASHERERFAS